MSTNEPGRSVEGSTEDATHVGGAEIMRYVKGRYFNDPEFHAQVETAVNVLARNHPVSLTDQERSLATTAAAVGLAMQWVDIKTGRITDD